LPPRWPREAASVGTLADCKGAAAGTYRDRVGSVAAYASAAATGAAPSNAAPGQPARAKARPPNAEPMAPPPKKVAEVVVAEDPEWRQLATADDIDRLDHIDEAWDQALAEARDKGFRRAVENEAQLLDPSAALPFPAPSPGAYRCRTIKLGSRSGGPTFAAFKPFFCHVETDGTLLNIVKQTGTQRPAGWLYPHTDDKDLIFLGTLAVGTEEVPVPYGHVAERNVAGMFQRIGDFRYRLVLPWPREDSKLDVIELVPVVQ